MWARTGYVYVGRNYIQWACFLGTTHINHSSNMYVDYEKSSFLNLTIKIFDDVLNRWG